MDSRLTSSDHRGGGASPYTFWDKSMYGWRGILPVDNLIKTTFVYDNDFNSKNPFVKYL